MENNLIKRAEESLKEQLNEVQKKVEALVKAEKMETAVWLKEKAEKNLSILQEMIFCLKSRPQIEEDDIYAIIHHEPTGIKGIHHAYGKEAARAASIAKAVETWPELYDPFTVKKMMQ